MKQAAHPFVLDGVVARLYPGPGRSLATGPGRLGRSGAAGNVLWQASDTIYDLDLFAGFWAFDAGQIDWLSGFLCDPATSEMFLRLAEPAADEEEPEEIYARASMNTLENDLQDEYS